MVRITYVVLLLRFRKLLIYFQFYLAHLTGFVAMLQIVRHILLKGLNARRMIVARQPPIASMCALFCINICIFLISPIYLKHLPSSQAIHYQLPSNYFYYKIT